MGVRFWDIALILLVVGCAYGGTVGHDLLGWDDIDYVTENPVLRLPWGEFVRAVFGGFVPLLHGDYLPLTQLSYRLEFGAVGISPWLYHLNNVALYGLCSVALYGALLRLSRRPSVSLVVVLLCALHPLNVEVVAWVSERKSLLSGLFCWSALWLMIPREHGKPVESKRVLAACLLYGFACLSKTAVVFFPLLLLGRICIFGKTLRIRSILPILPFVLMAGLTAWGRMRGHELSGQGRFAPFDVEGAYSLPTHVLTILSIMGRYVSKIILPLGLNHCYPLAATHGAAVPAVWIGGAFLVAALVCMVVLRKRMPLASFGLLWFLSGWIPHMQLTPIPPALWADRYMFYSMPGLFLFCADLLERAMVGMSAANKRMVAVAPVALLIAALGVAAHQRAKVWRDDCTLWEDSLAKEPDTPMANSHYGVLLYAQGRVSEAEAHFRKALSGERRNLMALNGMAAVVAGRGDHARALELLRDSLAVREDVAETHASIGEYELARRNAQAAVEAYARAVQLKPHVAANQTGYAAALLVVGRLEESLAHHERAVQLAPNQPTVLYNYAIALSEAERFEEALSVLEHCIRIEPTQVNAYAQMGVIHARLGQWTDAVRGFQEASRLAPEDERIQRYLQRARESQGSAQPAD